VERFKNTLVRKLKMVPSLMPDWRVRPLIGSRPGNHLRLLSTRGASPKPTCWSTRRNPTTFMWWYDGLGFLAWGCCV
jgi:hypothetical protein